MDLKLESLTFASLTNLEAGQLITRHLNDLATIDETLLTDAPYNAYVQQLGAKLEVLTQSINQIRKSEETEKIVEADAARDKAVAAFGMALKLHASAIDEEEVESARSLGILYGAYKNVTKLNYEAESLAIEKLVNELNTEAYIGKINGLHMQKYVDRMATTNANFKSIFSQRMVNNATTEVYDAKLIRKEILVIYNDFCSYVLALAKALNTPLFVNALNLLNAGRKYYADLLARRSGGSEPPAAPATE